jgi:glycosyltransferase involved in cell wall biosynthesis
VKRLAENLSRRGSEVRVVAGGADDTDEFVAGIRCQRVKLAVAGVPTAYQDPQLPFVPPWSDRRLGSVIRSCIQEWAPDVVHAHGWCEMAAAKVATEAGVPLVVTLHDYGLLCPQKSLFRGGKSCDHFASLRCTRCPGSSQGDPKRLALAAALRTYSRRQPAALYIAVSTHVRKVHEEGLRGRDIVVIPNFIDTDDRSAISARFAGPFPEIPTALFVGPDLAYKGAGVFRSAYAHLCASGWPGRFVHVGGSHQDEYRGFRSAGRLSGLALAAEYKKCSVLVAPALYADPCPTVILEAMDAGRPVIASKTGGHPDLVGEDSGITVEVGDVRATAGAIATLVADPIQLATRGEAARRRVRAFSSEAVVPQLEDAYRSVIDQAGRRFP